VISHDEMTIFEKNSLRKLLEKIEVSNWVMRPQTLQKTQRWVPEWNGGRRR
jgi:hypothetical protein